MQHSAIIWRDYAGRPATFFAHFSCNTNMVDIYANTERLPIAIGYMDAMEIRFLASVEFLCIFWWIFGVTMYEKHSSMPFKKISHLDTHLQSI